MPYTLITSSVYFALPGRHNMKPKMKTTANFCGNYISNTIMQDTVINAVYIVGTWIYLYVLRRIPAALYFKLCNPAFMVVLAGSATLLAFPLNQMLEYVVLSSVVGACWFLFLYDNFLATSAVDVRYYGFYSFVIGYVQTLPNVAAFWIMSYQVPPKLLLYVAQGMLVLCGAYGWWFGMKSQKVLTAAGKEEGGC